MPIHDNAFDRYQQVLVLDENNAAALAGLRAIAGRYLALAQAAFKGGEQARAARYRQKARNVVVGRASLAQWLQTQLANEETNTAHVVDEPKLAPAIKAPAVERH